jgi:hypothetical protein
MVFSYLSALLKSAFLDLAHWLHKRFAARLPLLLTGIRFARGRRTVTSWFRAAGISDDHRQGYVTVCAAGRASNSMALTIQAAVRPLLDRQRLLPSHTSTATFRVAYAVWRVRKGMLRLLKRYPSAHVQVRA